MSEPEMVTVSQALIDDFVKRIWRRDQRLDELEALIREWDAERTEKAAKVARLVGLLRQQVHRLWAYQPVEPLDANPINRNSEEHPVNNAQQTAIDWSTDLTTQLEEGGETYPFTEDENGNVTGYGHQDKAAFAAAINRYDEEATGEPLADPDDAWEADDINHQWVTFDDRTELFTVATQDAPGAFAITTLWGAR